MLTIACYKGHQSVYAIYYILPMSTIGLIWFDSVLVLITSNPELVKHNPVSNYQSIAIATSVVPPLGGPPAPPVVFTLLTPALANTANYIDLMSSSDAKHFKGATEPLNAKPFNFTDPSDLQVFLDLVLKKFASSLGLEGLEPHLHCSGN
jgi:hypothetical protein